MKNYIYTVVICLQGISIVSMLLFAFALLLSCGSGHILSPKKYIFMVTMSIISFIGFRLLSVWKENIKGK